MAATGQDLMAADNPRIEAVARLVQQSRGVGVRFEMLDDAISGQPCRHRKRPSLPTCANRPRGSMMRRRPFPTALPTAAAQTSGPHNTFGDVERWINAAAMSSKTAARAVRPKQLPWSVEASRDPMGLRPEPAFIQTLANAASQRRARQTPLHQTPNRRLSAREAHRADDAVPAQTRAHTPTPPTLEGTRTETRRPGPDLHPTHSSTAEAATRQPSPHPTSHTNAKQCRW